MTPLTALDLARIPFRRLGPTSHTFTCPSCGGSAWAGRAHLQCTSPECRHKVFAPLDILHLVWKAPYEECVEIASATIGRRPDYGVALSRKSARQVLDVWFDLCRRPLTAAEIMLCNALSRSGMDTFNLGNSAAILNSVKIKSLIATALETGATVPDRWLEEPPETSMAYVVQSNPHTIDRIAVTVGKTTQSIVWHKKRAGLSGLIDTDPCITQFLSPSKADALILQKKLRRSGHVPHIISCFYDQYAEFTDGGWLPDDIPVMAVINGAQDIVTIQRTIDQFPGMEDTLTATTESALTDITPSTSHSSWSSLRTTAIKYLCASSSKRIDSRAASLFEQTGSRPDDAALLVDIFTRDGNLELANDMRRLAENHIIFQDNSCTVRETYNSYRVFTRHGNIEVANFALRLRSSVIFGDVNSEVYYRGTVGHGNRKTDALISRTALESVKHLQQELQVVAAVGDGVIPTVIDIGQMRSKVMPYLSAQAARLPVIRGINFLGWSPDRKFFQASGLSIDIDGVRQAPTVFHPAVHALRPFREVSTWGEVCPEIHQDAQTLIAMMLALTVRSYKRCVTRPIKVVQSSDALTLLNGIMNAMGQDHILELNANARDARIQQTGITGYPCVAAGYSNQQIAQSTYTYTILSDEGFRITDEMTAQDGENAGRAAQFALVRLAEWCVATQADEFREIPSTDWHNSLMREGQWLMEHVCRLQPWEVRMQEITAIEQVFGQIPLSKIHDRMVLLNGVTLKIDCKGLTADPEKITDECAKIGANCTVENDALLIPAAPIITSVHRFYGCDPGIKVVLA